MPHMSTEDKHAYQGQNSEVFVTQLGFNSKEQSWQVQLSNSTQPCALELPDDLQEKLLKWYLEDHPLSDPLETVKTSAAETHLRLYGSKLLRQLSPISALFPSSGVSILVQEDTNETQTRSINDLHWETIEDEDLKSQGAPNTVMRVVRTEIARKDRFAHLKVPGPFRVLLVAARADLSETNHRLATNSLVRCANFLGNEILQVDIVRPGTFRAFKKHLARASRRGIHYNLVHFDVHGSVKEGTESRSEAQGLLHFYPKEEDDSARGAVKAPTVASVISKYNIPYVVMNACETANNKAGREGNLARVFVQKGIPLVLAMSYKLLTSAIDIFTTSFYEALLIEGKSFPVAASIARKAMRMNKTRAAKLGLPILLEDWIVPVTYVSHEMIDPRRVCHHRYIHRHRERPVPPSQKPSNKWDTELLNLEMRLLDPWDCGSGPVVNLYGFSGIGKTNLMEYCLRWWTKTGMVQKAIYFSFRQSGYVEPSSVLPHLARALNGREPNPIHIVSAIEQNPFPHFEGPLDTIFTWLTANDADRRFLLVLDDFPTYQSTTDFSPLSVAQKSAWKNLLYTNFGRFQKQALVIIASSSRLQWLAPGSRIDSSKEDVTIEDPHLNGDNSPASPFYCMPGTRYFLSEIRSADAAFWMSLDNPEQLQLLGDIAEYFGYLPPLVDHFIARPIRDSSTPSQERYEQLKFIYECLLRGRGPATSFDDEEYFAETLPITQICATYFDRQGPVEKAILLSLSKFVGHLGDDLPSYWLDYIQCLTTDVSRCLPREYYPHHHHWILHRHKPKHWIVDLEKEHVDETTLSQKGKKVLNELCRLGLLKQVFFFLKLNHDHQLDKEPAYQIHPCLSLFLQEKSMRDIPRPDNYSSNDTWTFAARTKASFLTYLRRRLETWDGASSPFAIETDSPEFLQALDSNIEEGLLRKSVLAGLHMWLEMDTNQHDISYSKAVFEHYLAPWPAMTRDIEPSTIAELVDRIRPSFESNFKSEYADARAQQQHAFSRAEAKHLKRRSQQFDDRKVDDELKKAHEALISSLVSLRQELQLGTWVVWYDVLCGKPKAALQQIEVNQKVLETLPQPKFSEIAAFVPGLQQEIQQAQLVSGFLTKSSEVALSQLDENEELLENLVQRLFGWTLRVDDPVARKFNAVGPRLLSGGFHISRAGLTWGIRTQEENDDLKIESEKLLREAFEGLVKIPLDWYKNRWNMLPRVFSEIASYFGINTGELSITWDAVLEFLSSLPKDISRPLKKFVKLFETAKGNIAAGQNPTAVFDAYHDRFISLITTTWRSAVLFFLDYTMHTNQLIEATAYHQFIIADYFYRRDWAALDMHLTRLTSSTERGGDPQWEFCRGVAALRLHRWEEAGSHLETALQATHNLTQYQLTNFALFGTMGVFAVRCFILRHFIAYKYAVPAERDSCTLPAWSVYLQYWILGYATKRKMNYAQNGAILEMFTEHYFGFGEEPRSGERVLDQHREEEYGRAMVWYNTPESRTIHNLKLPQSQLEAHVLLDFIHHAMEKGFFFDDNVEQTILAADTFFRSFQLERAFREANSDYSMKFLNDLAQKVVKRNVDLKRIFQDAERRLFEFLAEDEQEVTIGQEENTIEQSETEHGEEYAQICEMLATPAPEGFEGVLRERRSHESSIRIALEDLFEHVRAEGSA